MKIVWWNKEKEYYGENVKQEDEKTLRLLQEIKTRWKIDSEICKDFNDGEVYNEIFLKRRTRLKKNSDVSVKSLRSRQGRGNIYVDGTICVFENDEPIFFQLSWKRNEFLEKLLESGIKYIEQKIKENRDKLSKASPELQLVKDFLLKAKDFDFTGTFEEDYPLKIPAKESSSEFTKRFSYVAQKEIDIVHKASNGCFDIIEAKVKLNWAALGQAIGYMELFSKINNIPKNKICSLVICRRSYDFIEYVCRLFNVKVLVIPEAPPSD